MIHAIPTHIEIRSNREGEDRAFIHGTRVRVQDVAMLAEVQGRTPDQIVDAFPHLTLAQIHAALSYYFDHWAEFQDNLRDDEAFFEKLQKLCGSGVLVRGLKSTDDVVST